MKLERLDINSIDFSDERFRISLFAPIESMILSIEKIGLINPLLVTLRDGDLVLVSGWKRAISCQKLSLSPIPVFRIEENDDLNVFKIAFFENLATRSFSILEKAEIVRKLKEFGEKEKDIIKSFLPLLDIPSTWHYFKTYLAFSRFEARLKGAVHEKKMPFLTLKFLSEFDQEERMLVLPLIMPLGQNKQKEILADLFELSRKDGVTVDEILRSREIRKACEAENLSPLQKSDQVRMILKRKRNPSLFNQKELVNSALKRMSWPHDIEIHPSPFFENEDFSLSFSFKNKQEYAQRVTKLKELAAKREFSEIFESPSDE